jgi:DNA-binding transcriptional LysR family regulator
MTIEIRHLRCFVAVADAGTFTRAATAVHLSQPALSRTIARLEAELGVALLDRSTHHVALTDEGRRFEPVARDALAAFDRATAAVGDRPTPLRFGHSWSSATHASAIVRAWRAQHPDRPITSHRSDERTAGLAHGDVDVALVRGSVDERRFRIQVIDREPRIAALPAAHRLARRSSLRLADLAAESLVLNTVSGTTTLDLWPTSRQPTVALDTATIDDWLIAIATATGFGVTAAATASLHPHPDVCFVPITDAPLIPVVVIWPRRSPHPDCRALATIAQRVVAQTVATQTHTPSP